MANKLLRTTRVSPKCSVKIYRDSEYDVFVVKTLVNGKVRGTTEEGDKSAARGTAAHEARWLRKQAACRNGR